MKKLKKFLIITTSILLIIFGVGYFGLKYLQHQLENKLVGCEIQNKNFYTSVPFDLVNNWILVKVKVTDSDEKFPFIFDTGAQTVLLDSLLNIIGKEQYDSYSYKEDSTASTNSFNNELITLHNLIIEKISFKNIGSISAKNSKWGMLNCVSPYGILGYNILQTLYSQIDYEKKEIIFTDDINKLPNYNNIQWINYEPSINQETPILKAIINDSIKISLFFDTGNSGGISLNSEKLYYKLANDSNIKAKKFISQPTIRIRGESDSIQESISFLASKFTLGDIAQTDVKINITNSEEREFTGFIGNKFLKDFIITLDYKKQRIGFIKRKETTTQDSGYGINYVPQNGNIVISSVYKNSKAYDLGIRPGDVVYSVNNILIKELNSEDLCNIYRNEYQLQNANDSILDIEIVNEEMVKKYSIKKYKLY